MGPLLFCIFIYDLPGIFRFSEPFIFADDLKILATNKTNEVQCDLKEIEYWLHGKNMQLAIVKCAQNNFRGSLNSLILNGITLEQKNKDRRSRSSCQQKPELEY